MAGLSISRFGNGVRVNPVTARTNQVRALAFGVSGRAGEVRPGAGLSFGGILKGVAKAAGGFLAGGPAGAIAATLPTVFSSQGKRSTPAFLPSSVTPFAPQPPPIDCPTGFVFRNGRCERAGVTGTVQRVLPGGQTGVLEPGVAVTGAFGLPAMQPNQVGTIQRADGSSGPIFRCNPGLVLGKDDLCYPKQVLGRRGKFRKYPAPQRPPITAADAKAIRKAASAKNRVKKLATNVGFSCRKR